MQLKDIYFGAIDAKNEINNSSSDKIERFEKIFLMPDNIDIDSFENGDKFLIYGLKGTGKTALLRYLDIYLQKKHYKTAFVLFKTDFSEEEKKEFNYQASNVLDYSNLKQEAEHKDFEMVWRWFFYRFLMNYMIRNNVLLFEDDDNWNKFYACIDAIKGENEQNKFFPKLKKGEVELNIKVIKGKLEFLNNNAKTVKFAKLVQSADDYFKKIRFIGKNRLYILVDELELEYTTKKAYDRDARIIRDLIVAVERFNLMCRETAFPIHFIVSVRSEVLTAVSSIGKEINKTIDDYGVSVSWHQAGGNDKDHPLIHIIMKRLLVAEQLQDTNQNVSYLRNQYFPDKFIQKIQLERYILNNSWYRPRDIVRLLNLAKENFPKETCFSHRVFDGIRKMYSTKSWTECLEELKAHYNNDQLQSIVHIFNGWKRDFSLQDIEQRIDELITHDERIEIFAGKNVTVFLERLYRMGIIGNKYWDNGTQRYRFIFRGDEVLFVNRTMTIHQALMPYFSL